MTLLTPKLLRIDSIIPSTRWSLNQDISIEPEQDLIESMARLGLLRPPIIKSHQNGYELLCGTKRLAALGILEYPSPIACLLVNKDVSWEDLLLLVAEDQIQSGPLSPIQAARFIALCNKWLEQPEEYQVLSRVTSTTSTMQRSRLLSLLELEKPVRASIHQDQISEKTGFSMATMSSTERIFVHDLFISLSLNGNKQRRFLELVQIITAVKGCTMEQFMTEHFPDLCNGEISNVPQQSNSLMKQLYELSHPESQAAKENFLKQSAEMNLPANCRVSPSPSFETDKVTLEMEFINFDAFSNVWDTIKKSL